MTSEKTKANQLHSESNERPAQHKETRNLDVWSRSAPIQLAGYEDDPAETNIFRGID